MCFGAGEWLKSKEQEQQEKLHNLTGPVGEMFVFALHPIISFTQIDTQRTKFHM